MKNEKKEGLCYEDYSTLLDNYSTLHAILTATFMKDTFSKAFLKRRIEESEKMLKVIQKIHKII